MSEPHCCRPLQDLCADRRVPVGYSPRTREWWLRLVTPDRGDDDAWRERGSVQLIDFCPFCGRHLPESLAERWWDELEALGFDDPHHQDLPEEFRSDQWWKDRVMSDASSGDADVTASADRPGPGRSSTRRVDVTVGSRRTPHACPSRYPFDDFIGDVRVPFAYRATIRAWGVLRVDDDSIPEGWWRTAALCPVPFCPWCGRPFPDPLIDERVEALAELGLVEDSPDIPEDLRTDRWWRARGHDRDEHVDPLPGWT